MAYVNNVAKIFPKYYPHNTRIQNLIIDSLKNKKFSIVVTNYNINHDVCENTKKHGQIVYNTTYTLKYTTYTPGNPYSQEFVKFIYNDVVKCMDTYPDYYVNIFTQECDASDEKTYMVRGPEREYVDYIEYNDF